MHESPLPGGDDGHAGGGQPPEPEHSHTPPEQAQSSLPQPPGEAYPQFSPSGEQLVPGGGGTGGQLGGGHGLALHSHSPLEQSQPMPQPPP